MNLFKGKFRPFGRKYLLMTLAFAMIAISLVVLSACKTEKKNPEDPYVIMHKASYGDESKMYPAYTRSDITAGNQGEQNVPYEIVDRPVRATQNFVDYVTTNPEAGENGYHIDIDLTFNSMEAYRDDPETGLKIPGIERAGFRLRLLANVYTHDYFLRDAAGNIKKDANNQDMTDPAEYAIYRERIKHNDIILEWFDSVNNVKMLGFYFDGINPSATDPGNHLYLDLQGEKRLFKDFGDSVQYEQFVRIITSMPQILMGALGGSSTYGSDGIAYNDDGDETDPYGGVKDLLWWMMPDGYVETANDGGSELRGTDSLLFATNISIASNSEFLDMINPIIEGFAVYGDRFDPLVMGLLGFNLSTIIGDETKGKTRAVLTSLLLSLQFDVSKPFVTDNLSSTEVLTGLHLFSPINNTTTGGASPSAATIYRTSWQRTPDGKEADDTEQGRRIQGDWQQVYTPESVPFLFDAYIKYSFRPSESVVFDKDGYNEYVWGNYEFVGELYVPDANLQADLSVKTDVNENNPAKDLDNSTNRIFIQGYDISDNSVLFGAYYKDERMYLDITNLMRLYGGIHFEDLGFPKAYKDGIDVAYFLSLFFDTVNRFTIYGANSILNLGTGGDSTDTEKDEQDAFIQNIMNMITSTVKHPEDPSSRNTERFKIKFTDIEAIFGLSDAAIVEMLNSAAGIDINTIAAMFNTTVEELLRSLSFVFVIDVDDLFIDFEVYYKAEADDGKEYDRLILRAHLEPILIGESVFITFPKFEGYNELKQIETYSADLNGQFIFASQESVNMSKLLGAFIGDLSGKNTPYILPKGASIRMEGSYDQYIRAQTLKLNLNSITADGRYTRATRSAFDIVFKEYSDQYPEGRGIVRITANDVSFNTSSPPDNLGYVWVQFLAEGIGIPPVKIREDLFIETLYEYMGEPTTDDISISVGVQTLLKIFMEDSWIIFEPEVIRVTTSNDYVKDFFRVDEMIATAAISVHFKQRVFGVDLMEKDYAMYTVGYLTDMPDLYPNIYNAPIHTSLTVYFDFGDGTAVTAIPMQFDYDESTLDPANANSGVFYPATKGQFMGVIRRYRVRVDQYRLQEIQKLSTQYNPRVFEPLEIESAPYYGFPVSSNYNNTQALVYGGGISPNQYFDGLWSFYSYYDVESEYYVIPYYQDKGYSILYDPENMLYIVDRGLSADGVIMPLDDLIDEEGSRFTDLLKAEDFYYMHEDATTVTLPNELDGRMYVDVTPRMFDDEAGNRYYYVFGEDAEGKHIRNTYLVTNTTNTYSKILYDKDLDLYIVENGNAYYQNGRWVTHMENARDILKTEKTLIYNKDYSEVKAQAFEAMNYSAVSDPSVPGENFVKVYSDLFTHILYDIEIDRYIVESGYAFDFTYNKKNVDLGTDEIVTESVSHITHAREVLFGQYNLTVSAEQFLLKSDYDTYANRAGLFDSIKWGDYTQYGGELSHIQLVTNAKFVYDEAPNAMTYKYGIIYDTERDIYAVAALDIGLYSRYGQETYELSDNADPRKFIYIRKGLNGAQDLRGTIELDPLKVARAFINTETRKEVVLTRAQYEAAKPGVFEGASVNDSVWANTDFTLPSWDNMPQSGGLFFANIDIGVRGGTLKYYRQLLPVLVKNRVIEESGEISVINNATHEASYVPVAVNAVEMDPYVYLFTKAYYENVLKEFEWKRDIGFGKLDADNQPVSELLDTYTQWLMHQYTTTLTYKEKYGDTDNPEEWFFDRTVFRPKDEQPESEKWNWDFDIATYTRPAGTGTYITTTQEYHTEYSERDINNYLENKTDIYGRPVEDTVSTFMIMKIYGFFVSLEIKVHSRNIAGVLFEGETELNTYTVDPLLEETHIMPQISTIVFKETGLDGEPLTLNLNSLLPSKSTIFDNEKNTAEVPVSFDEIRYGITNAEVVVFDPDNYANVPADNTNATRYSLGAFTGWLFGETQLYQEVYTAYNTRFEEGVVGTYIDDEGNKQTNVDVLKRNLVYWSNQYASNVKLVNEFVYQRDSDGNYIDVNGLLIDEKGFLIDQFGRYVSEGVYIYVAQGEVEGQYRYKIDDSLSTFDDITYVVEASSKVAGGERAPLLDNEQLMNAPWGEDVYTDKTTAFINFREFFDPLRGTWYKTEPGSGNTVSDYRRDYTPWYYIGGENEADWFNMPVITVKVSVPNRILDGIDNSHLPEGEEDVTTYPGNVYMSPLAFGDENYYNIYDRGVWYVDPFNADTFTLPANLTMFFSPNTDAFETYRLAVNRRNKAIADGVPIAAQDAKIIDATTYLIQETIDLELFYNDNEQSGRSLESFIFYRAFLFKQEWDRFMSGNVGGTQYIEEAFIDLWELLGSATHTDAVDLIKERTAAAILTTISTDLDVWFMGQLSTATYNNLSKNNINEFIGQLENFVTFVDPSLGDKQYIYTKTPYTANYAPEKPAEYEYEWATNTILYSTEDLHSDGSKTYNLYGDILDYERTMAADGETWSPLIARLSKDIYTVPGTKTAIQVSIGNGENTVFFQVRIEVLSSDVTSFEFGGVDEDGYYSLVGGGEPNEQAIFGSDPGYENNHDTDIELTYNYEVDTFARFEIPSYIKAYFTDYPLRERGYAVEYTDWRWNFNTLDGFIPHSSLYLIGGGVEISNHEDSSLKIPLNFDIEEWSIRTVSLLNIDGIYGLGAADIGEIYEVDGAQITLRPPHFTNGTITIPDEELPYDFVPFTVEEYYVDGKDMNAFEFFLYALQRVKIEFNDPLTGDPHEDLILDLLTDDTFNFYRYIRTFDVQEVAYETGGQVYQLHLGQTLKNWDNPVDVGESLPLYELLFGDYVWETPSDSGLDEEYGHFVTFMHMLTMGGADFVLTLVDEYESTGVKKLTRENEEAVVHHIKLYDDEANALYTAAHPFVFNRELRLNIGYDGTPVRPEDVIIPEIWYLVIDNPEMPNNFVGLEKSDSLAFTELDYSIVNQGGDAWFTAMLADGSRIYKRLVVDIANPGPIHSVEGNTATPFAIYDYLQTDLEGDIIIYSVYEVWDSIKALNAANIRTIIPTAISMEGVEIPNVKWVLNPALLTLPTADGGRPFYNVTSVTALDRTLLATARIGSAEYGQDIKVYITILPFNINKITYSNDVTGAAYEGILTPNYYGIENAYIVEIDAYRDYLLSGMLPFPSALGLQSGYDFSISSDSPPPYESEGEYNYIYNRTGTGALNYYRLAKDVVDPLGERRLMQAEFGSNGPAHKDSVLYHVDLKQAGTPDPITGRVPSSYYTNPENWDYVNGNTKITVTVTLVDGKVLTIVYVFLDKTVTSVEAYKSGTAIAAMNGREYYSITDDNLALRAGIVTREGLSYAHTKEGFEVATGLYYDTDSSEFEYEIDPYGENTALPEYFIVHFVSGQDIILRTHYTQVPQIAYDTLQFTALTEMKPSATSTGDAIVNLKIDVKVIDRRLSEYKPDYSAGSGVSAAPVSVFTTAVAGDKNDVPYSYWRFEDIFVDTLAGIEKKLLAATVANGAEYAAGKPISLFDDFTGVYKSATEIDVIWTAGGETLVEGSQIIHGKLGNALTGQEIAIRVFVDDLTFSTIRRPTVIGDFTPGSTVIGDDPSEMGSTDLSIMQTEVEFIFDPETQKNVYKYFEVAFNVRKRTDFTNINTEGGNVYTEGVKSIIFIPAEYKNETWAAAFNTHLLLYGTSPYGTTLDELKRDVNNYKLGVYYLADGQGTVVSSTNLRIPANLRNGTQTAVYSYDFPEIDFVQFQGFSINTWVVDPTNPYIGATATAYVYESGIPVSVGTYQASLRDAYAGADPNNPFQDQYFGGGIKTNYLVVFRRHFEGTAEWNGDVRNDYVVELPITLLFLDMRPDVNREGQIYYAGGGKEQAIHSLVTSHYDLDTYIGRSNPYYTGYETYLDDLNAAVDRYFGHDPENFRLWYTITWHTDPQNLNAPAQVQSDKVVISGENRDIYFMTSTSARLTLYLV
ncbi:MAG: hypothetical protein LBN25_03930 [Christensenellaceae bacterium]|nr:hypothetical protein [Christensenellaceae bacterium]